MRPKLYAVFDKDGQLYLPNRGVGRPHKWRAWLAVSSGDAETRRLKRAGYTCEEVEIVRVKK